MSQVSQRARRLIKSWLFVITLNPKIWCQSSGLYWDDSWWISAAGKWKESTLSVSLIALCFDAMSITGENAHFKMFLLSLKIMTTILFCGGRERKDKWKEWCWWKEMITSRWGFDRRKGKFLCQVSVRMKTKPAVSTGQFDFPSPVLPDCKITKAQRYHGRS